jgi:hypothetical protein
MVPVAASQVTAVMDQPIVARRGPHPMMPAGVIAMLMLHVVSTPPTPAKAAP